MVKKSKSKKSKPKKVNLTTIKTEKWKIGEVFTARNEKGRFVSWGTKKKFKTQSKFQTFIKDKAFLFGKNIFDNKTDRIKIGKEVAEITTKKFIVPKKKIRAFRVIALYKNFAASSGLLPSFSKEDFEALKEQALFNLATQILVRRKGFVTTNAEIVEENEDDIIQLMDDIRRQVKFRVTYSQDI